MKKISSLILGLITLLTTISAQKGSSPLFSFSKQEEAQIHVHNRILAKVNGKPISVIDVMKKMDIVFYREFPEYTSFPEARFQFYQASWKSILQELINKELILADSEENKLILNNSEVRQEMETLFGPNIIANLDKIGMTMEEATKIVKGDLIIRRMLMARVNSRAIRQITPQEIRGAYEKYSKENRKSDEWHYRVISIRDKDATKGAVAASKVEELINNKPTSFEALAENIKALPGIEKSTNINVSEEFVHNDLQLSPLYKEILVTLGPGAYTPPLSQKSRSDKSTVYRVFYLKEKVPGGIVAFDKIEFELKEKLLSEAIAKESEAYIKRLKTHYAVSDNMLQQMVPEDFQPFTLK